MLDAAQAFLHVPLPMVTAVGVSPEDDQSVVNAKIDQAVSDLGVHGWEQVLFLVDLVGSTPARLCCGKCGRQGTRRHWAQHADAPEARHRRSKLWTSRLGIDAGPDRNQVHSRRVATMMLSAKLKIVNKAGLHARASTRFVQAANKYRCNVTVKKDDQEVNGKSIMGVLLLVASIGSEITVGCDGDDAKECLQTLTELVQSGFGEN
jgi:phosphocarrier protein HPr